MPIPQRNLTESKDEYLSRCISFLVDEGKDTEQASAICYTQLNKQEMKNPNIEKFESLKTSRDLTNEELASISKEEFETCMNQLAGNVPGNSYRSKAFEKVCYNRILARKYQESQDNPV
jgi:hypothetical protein